MEVPLVTWELLSPASDRLAFSCTLYISVPLSLCQDPRIVAGEDPEAMWSSVSAFTDMGQRDKAVCSA